MNLASRSRKFSEGITKNTKSGARACAVHTRVQAHTHTHAHSARLEKKRARVGPWDPSEKTVPLCTSKFRARLWPWRKKFCWTEVEQLHGGQGAFFTAQRSTEETGVRVTCTCERVRQRVEGRLPLLYTQARPPSCWCLPASPFWDKGQFSSFLKIA